MSAPPKVVVVGAGFGGLEAARGLARVPVEVTVVDRHNHHTFQPLLYQVATAALSPADIAWPIRAILREQRNARVLLGAVSAVDTAARIVRTPEFEVPYDILVLATGATHSYFGHEQWADAAPGLKRIEDATSIRRRLLMAFERAEAAADDTERRRLLTFVIVGGGATGVEMAGALMELASNALKSDFRTIDPQSARIVLVEAGPRLIATLPEELSRYTETILMKRGVEVRTGTMVTGCDSRGVDLVTQGTSGRIDSSTIIWAAGVVASPAAAWISAPHDRAGRITVEPDLTVPGHPEIFALGDTAAVKDANGNPVPGIAPAAKQMGRYVACVIAARVSGSAAPPPFRYRHQGDLAAIGRNAAVVHLGWLKLTGFLGWLFWGLVHIYFLIGARNRVGVAFKWAWDYVTMQRGVRLITTAPPR
jgi:NADH:ubiquinone reductase (H+-translocating)